jgi:hypothetical protein
MSYFAFSYVVSSTALNHSRFIAMTAGGRGARQAQTHTTTMTKKIRRSKSVNYGGLTHHVISFHPKFQPGGSLYPTQNGFSDSNSQKIIDFDSRG